MKHRACRALLCLVLVGSLLLSMTVEALADLTTIGTDASRPEYFEALGASGNYNPLKTPYHYDKTTGNVAYCLEHRKDSPSSSAEYTDFDASALWGRIPSRAYRPSWITATRTAAAGSARSRRTTPPRTPSARG